MRILSSLAPGWLAQLASVPECELAKEYLVELLGNQSETAGQGAPGKAADIVASSGIAVARRGVFGSSGLGLVGDRGAVSMRFIAPA